MRALIWVVGALAALYAGFWFVARGQVESRLTAALDDLEAKGWTVAYDDLSVAGFPSRLDTTLTGLSLADPGGEVAWSTPFVQVFALSYRPNRVIAVWPPEQAVTVAGTPVTVGSEDLRASASTGFSLALPFRAATVEAQGLDLAAPGWEVTTGHALVAARSAGGAAYDLYLDLAGAALEQPALALDVVRLDAQVTLDRPIDRRLEGAPVPTSLHLKEARLSRGDLALTVSGDLAAGADGVVEGELVVVAEDWLGMLDLAQTAGLLDEGRRALFERALGMLGDEDRIEVPVTFADGRVSALGLPLLDAPRLPVPAP